MKANELRIGNWVLWNGPSHTENALVSIISEGEIHFSCGDSGLINEIEGIPLTEKWLINLGFEKTMSWTYSIELTGNLNLVYYLGEKGWSMWFSNYSKFSDLKYVHQLQNLYFALIGKELTLENIKETYGKNGN